MQHDAVEAYHWLTGAQFLNAVALGQITPGPVVRDRRRGRLRRRRVGRRPARGADRIHAVVRLRARRRAATSPGSVPARGSRRSCPVPAPRRSGPSWARRSRSASSSTMCGSSRSWCSPGLAPGLAQEQRDHAGGSRRPGDDRGVRRRPPSMIGRVSPRGER